MKIGYLGRAAIAAGWLASIGQSTPYSQGNLETRVKQSQAQNVSIRNQEFIKFRDEVKRRESDYKFEDPYATDISYRIGRELIANLVDYFGGLGIPVYSSPVYLSPEPAIFSSGENVVVSNIYTSIKDGSVKQITEDANWIKLENDKISIEKFHYVNENNNGNRTFPHRFWRYNLVQKDGKMQIEDLDVKMSDELQLPYLDNFDFRETQANIAQLSRELKTTRDKEKEEYLWRGLRKISEYFMLKCGLDLDGSDPQIDAYRNMIRIWAYTYGYSVDTRRGVQGAASLIIYSNGKADESVNLDDKPGDPVLQWKTEKIDLALDCNIK